MESRYVIFFADDDYIYRKILYRLDQSDAIVAICDGEVGGSNYDYNISPEEYSDYITRLGLSEDNFTEEFDIR